VARVKDFPWMTAATLLFTIAYLLSAVTAVLPPEYAAIAGSVTFAAGAIGKALFEIGRNGGSPPTMNQDDGHDGLGS
jgi:hypothetical protein